MNILAGFRDSVLALCVVAVFASPALAFAQDGPGVEIGTAAFQEVEVKADDGTTSKKLVPAARVVPGDEVVYEITYSNKGSEPATGVAIDNPVPPAVTFVQSTNPPTAVSVDLGKTFGNLGDLVVEGPDGQVRPAQPSDITHLRWTIVSLAPGADGTIRYRVRVK